MSMVHGTFRLARGIVALLMRLLGRTGPGGSPPTSPAAR
jgi:hypothetical protein